jgi:hypothetical protein
MWPGRRGLRFTRAKVVGVEWKTYRFVSAWVRVLVLVVGGYGGSRTWEVTVKGPNLMSLFVRDAILDLFSG